MFISRSISRLQVATIVCAAMASSTTPVTAQIFHEENPSLPTGAAAGDLGGFSVAIDGNTMAMGCVQHGNLGPGLVRVFVRNTTSGPWSLQETLVAIGGSSLDEFGRSVSISGNRIVVGAPSKMVNGFDAAGAAYVFDRSGTTWGPGVEILPSKIGSGYSFGGSVAIRGTTILVGAARTNQPGFSGAGALFAFELGSGTWTERKIITSNAPVVDAMFGASISFEGDRCLVAAPRDNAAAIDTGAAYVFRRTTPGDNTTWTFEDKLFNPTGAAKDEFGSGTALSGDRICIGAHQRDVAGVGIDSGEAYIFERTGTNWSLVATLLPCFGQVDAHFGVETALQGDLVAIGAHVEDNPVPGGPDSGSVYIFQRNSASTWTQAAKLHPAAPSPDDRLGSSLAFQGKTLLVGATRFDGPGAILPEIGCVYDFTLRKPSFVPYGTGCPCTPGIIPTLSMDATPLCGGGAFTTLMVANSFSPTNGFVLIGPVTSLATGNGCTLLVSPVNSIGIPIPGNGPGAGQVSLGAPLPPASMPFVVGLQVFILSPSSPQGYCATNGVLFSVN